MINISLNKLINSLPQSINLKLSQIDELKGRWIGGANLNPQVLGRLKKSVLVTSTGASTRIEGARLSDEEIEKMMKGISIQNFTNRDEQEVQGYFELLSNVFSSHQKLHFSESLINHFHQELLKYVDKDQSHRGDYKSQDNKVHMVDGLGKSVGVLFDTTPVYLTPTQTKDLIEKTQQLMKDSVYHPLLIIGVFIVCFLQIHPFTDGNGRLSRILTNLLLLQSGFEYVPYISHEKVIEDNKPDYYMALRTSQKTFSGSQASILAWMDFFLDVVLKQAEQAVGLLTAENLEKLLSPTQLSVWKYLQQEKEATPLELSKKLSIPRPTINQVTDRLMSLKKIERLGQGRAVRYKVI